MTCSSAGFYRSQNYWMLFNIMQLSKRNKLYKKIIKLFLYPFLFAYKLILRWLLHAWKSIVGPSGYVVISTLGGIYFALFSLAQADSERSTQSANTQLAAFFSLISSSDQSGIRFAINNFRRMNTIVIYEQPSIWEPLSWWSETYHQEPITSAWLVEKLNSCNKSLCGNKDWRVFAPKSLFSNISLRHSDNEYQRLYKAYYNFSGSNFDGSNFNKSMLSGDISDSSFVGSDFEGAFLFEVAKNTNFSHSHMSHSRIGSIPSGNDGVFRRGYEGTRFVGITAICASITYTDLQNAMFYGNINPELRKVDLARHYSSISSDSDLRYADFNGTDLKNVNFTNANLKFAKFDKAINVREAIFTNAIVEEESWLSKEFPNVVKIEPIKEWENPDRSEYCSRYERSRYYNRLSYGWYADIRRNISEVWSEIGEIWQEFVDYIYDR